MPFNPNQSLISSRSVTLGCDPELFLMRKGKVIGSEKVVPEEGLHHKPYPKEKFPSYSQGDWALKQYEVIRDGVQVELNPAPGTCRESLGQQISGCLKQLHARLTTMKDINISFKATVTVPQRELLSLSEKSRILGCAPSLNIYAPSSITVDPITYRKRSGGGHIHLGINNYGPQNNLPPDRLVALLDILLGNTCVMIDRDRQAATRRKVYGRAGEYRTPPHGVEYRTLSNFWLRHFSLMSFVFGVARQCVYILDNSLRTDFLKRQGYGKVWGGLEADLLSRVDMKKVQKAINTNNLKLAKENWQGVRSFIEEHIPPDATGLASDQLTSFDTFLAKIEEKGIEYWFPDDPLKGWLHFNYKGKGWESFIMKTAPSIVAAKKREVSI